MDDKEYAKIHGRFVELILKHNTQELRALLASPSGDTLRKRERSAIGSVVCNFSTERRQCQIVWGSRSSALTLRVNNSSGPVRRSCPKPSKSPDLTLERRSSRRRTGVQ